LIDFHSPVTIFVFWHTYFPRDYFFPPRHWHSFHFSNYSPWLDTRGHTCSLCFTQTYCKWECYTG